MHCTMCSAFDKEQYTSAYDRTAPEASWKWVFDPMTGLLFDLYHQLRTKRTHECVPEHAQVLCQNTPRSSTPGTSMLPGSTTAGVQEGFRAATAIELTFENFGVVKLTPGNSRMSAV